jgi:hypothetical protein
MKERSAGARQAATLPTSAVTSRADRFAARPRFHALEIQDRRQGMASHADQRAASRHRPQRGVCGMRSAVAFLRLHEEDLVMRGLEDFDGFRQRRCVHPILGIHEELAAFVDGRAELFHLGHDALEHQRFAHLLADRRRVVRTAEIAGKRLFADDVLSRAHGVDDHLRVQIRRRANIDHVDCRIGEKRTIVAMRLRDFVLLGESLDLIAPRHDRRDLGGDAIDALIGIHMQFGDEAAADETDSDLGHRRAARFVTRAGRR